MRSLPLMTAQAQGSLGAGPRALRGSTWPTASVSIGLCVLIQEGRPHGCLGTAPNNGPGMVLSLRAKWFIDILKRVEIIIPT